jgi:hypothetical protein
MLQYVGVLPFFINVEMPTTSRQGEQVGIRVTVFNYMPSPIEATVVLAGSPDYKFVHVGKNGIVSSHMCCYNDLLFRNLQQLHCIIIVVVVVVIIIIVVSCHRLSSRYYC